MFFRFLDVPDGAGNFFESGKFFKIFFVFLDFF